MEFISLIFSQVKFDEMIWIRKWVHLLEFHVLQKCQLRFGLQFTKILDNWL